MRSLDHPILWEDAELDEPEWEEARLKALNPPHCSGSGRRGMRASPLCRTVPLSHRPGELGHTAESNDLSKWVREMGRGSSSSLRSQWRCSVSVWQLCWVCLAAVATLQWLLQPRLVPQT